MKQLQLSPARIARSLVVILGLTLVQIAVAPTFSESAHAYTQGTATNGTAYGGTGGSANGANQNCTNGAIVAIGTSKSGDNLNTFMFVCKTINSDASLSSTEVTTNVFGTPAESDRCAAGQVAFGVRVIASNGGSLVGGVGLICGNPMSQGSQDTRAIMPNASSAGTVYTYTCSAGQLLAGFALRTGALVDQIIPKCSSFSGFVYGAVGAPSATVSGSTASVSFATVSGSIADTALTYTVTAVPNTGSTITVTGSSSPISIPGMVLRSYYTITVTASNTYGTSPSTSSASATMVLPGGDTDSALSLNGSTQYASVADTAGSPYDLTGAITLEAWVYPTTTCPSDQGVVAKNVSYMLYCGGGKWKYAYSSNGTSWGGNLTTIDVKAFEWHHLAYTKASGSDVLLVYYDGQLAQTISTGITTVGTNDNAIQIGRYGTGNSFTGLIDEVRIYNSQRSASQVANDLKTYGPISDSDLVAYYDFNELTGSTVYNRKPAATSATDLTLTGSPTWNTDSITATSIVGPYTHQTFFRSYLTSTGGWKVPSGVSQATVVVVGGGGGGGYGGSTNGAPAGAGGGGGVTVQNIASLTSGNSLTVTVGVGGIGGYNDTALSSDRNGQSSNLGLGAGISALGGGGGGKLSAKGASGSTIATGGGSGGSSYTCVGASAPYSPSGTPLYNDAVTSGYNGAYGIWGWGGAGGGARGAATNADCNNYQAGIPGPGYVDPVNNVEYGRGGSADRYSVASVIAGYKQANNGWGGIISYSDGNSDGRGYSGSAGTIIIRWITASKPTYTKPSNAYLNVGMTETFTTNVSSDSATVMLTRTFKWESTTPAANGTYSLIKQGTGAANASFSWIPSDTSTSGSGYLYRLTVTDSDTAGLFIRDSSTVFAIINKTLLVTGNSTIGKAINVTRNETFTIQFGTPTFKPTLAPVIPGISLDSSTAGYAVIKIADTMTVGTYYETLTVIDSVSASVVTPLVITVAAPPNLLNSGEITTNGLVLNLDAGNSASVIASDGSAITNIDIKDLAGSKKNAVSGSTYESQLCANPTYTTSNGGALVFNGTSQCAYLPYLGSNFDKSITLETWVKMPTGFSTGSAILTQNDASSTSDINIVLGGSGYAASGLRFQFRAGGASPTWPRPTNAITVINDTWMHIVGTYDGVNMKVYINNVLTDTYQTSVGLSGGAYANTNGYFIGVGWDTTSGSHYFSGSIATIRIYNRAISASEVSQNYNSTMSRFQSSYLDWLYPSQKYGSLNSETYTVTSGYGTRTTTFVVGDRTGIDWDTTTVLNQAKLSIQESLTVGTYNDTITVSDSLGQSTYLPIKVTIAKADTITVTLRNPTVLTYTGSPAAALPNITIVGLKNSDTGTVTRLYSAPASLPGSPDTYTALVNSAVVPTDVESYTVTSSALTLSVGLLSNYESVTYESSSLRILQAKQPTISVSPYGAYVGAPYTIVVIGGAGAGSITETVTAGSTASGCTISNHVLTMSSTFQSYCNLDIAKAATRNYLRETATVQVYFFSLSINQPAPAPGSGPGIALSGVTSITLDPNQAPTISSLSVSSGRVGDTVIITGAGFTASTLQSVKFWRNILASVTGTTTNTQITVIVPAGASTGKILVTTANGLAITEGSFTVLP